MTKDILSTALRIAANAHEGQTDRAGKPYILHPLRVAMALSSDDEIVTALLHDVMEDSDYGEEELSRAGIPCHIMEALRLLTHDKAESYMDYVRRIKGNELARAVKIADLRHNSDLGRLPEITEKDVARAEKYKQALSILEN